jgi:hypothetical protein
MYKRPSPFKHGCYNFNPPSQYDIQRLLADRAPYYPPQNKKVFKPSKDIMYPETYKRLVKRSELTTEKREEIFQQYKKDGDTDKYLKAMHLYPIIEPEANTQIQKKKENSVWWGYAKLVLTIEGDHVKVHVDGKLGDIQAKYFDKAKKPPLRPYVEALMSAGTPTEKINKVIDRYVWWKKNKNEFQMEFDRLFPPEKKKGTVIAKKVLKAVIKH